MDDGKCPVTLDVRETGFWSWVARPESCFGVPVLAGYPLPVPVPEEVGERRVGLEGELIARLPGSWKRGKIVERNGFSALLPLSKSDWDRTGWIQPLYPRSRTSPEWADLTRIGPTGPLAWWWWVLVGQYRALGSWSWFCTVAAVDPNGGAARRVSVDIPRLATSLGDLRG